ncbi:hypothetical protein BN77_3203 [Rhizobium mesoamericanum STM3625]|uniref:Uncharacterized protein n=1 Tax=Rhizobium mesoamericanum STM3625 TaxID=1211777 RepID=K0PHM9_9HYPH|nr:hypothetical protein BN77_3203 [Rhizobium mesoamericanum STM3625]
MTSDFVVVPDKQSSIVEIERPKLREDGSLTAVPESIARSHGRPEDCTSDPVVVIS